MTPQEILNSLELLADSKPLVDTALWLPRGPAHALKDAVSVTAQELRDFVQTVKALQKLKSNESRR